MAVWEKGTPTVSPDAEAGITGVAFGDRIDIDGSGPVWVKVLAPQYRLDDGDEYCLVGFGTETIVPFDYLEE